jgi:hypothetical protein
VSNARADPERVAHLATIRQAPGTSPCDAVMGTGWEKMPGSPATDRALALVCCAALDIPVN